MPIIFVYGTLRKNQIRHKLIEHCKFIGHGTVSGFVLLDLGAYPGAVTGDGTIYGELYEVEDAVIEWLDLVEGIGQGLFRRIQVEVQTENYKKVNAFMYVYSSNTSSARKIPEGDWIRYKNNI